MERTWEANFDHVGLDGDTHKVYARVKKIKEPDLANINRYVGDEARRAGNDEPELARHVALLLGIEKERAKIDGKWYNIRQGSKAPPIVIDEYDHTTLEHLLGYVIYYNTTLIDRERYRDAFEDYALEDEEKPQPTPFNKNQEDAS